MPAAAPSRRKRLVFALAMASALGACASSESMQRRPALPTTLFAPQADQTGAATWPAANWWESFGDPALNALVEHALGQSPDLAIIEARARRAAADASAARAAVLPSADLGANATRQRFTENGLVPPPYAGSWMNSGNVSARLAWSLDVFGAERARRAAVLSGARAAELDASFARNAVGAAVAELYYALAAAYDDRELLQHRLQQNDRLRAIAAGRRGAGLDDAAPLQRADVQLTMLKQELAQADERIERTAAQLAALAGEGPQWSLARQRPAPRPLPADWSAPATLNAELLGHRADVVAARERVSAAVDEVQAAKRDYFPNLSLAALAGLDSFTLSSLFDAGSRTFSVGPALSLPLFDGGRRHAAGAARRADYDAAVADYRRSVLAAVREAAQALTRLQSSRDQQLAAAAALDVERTSWQLARRRAERGLATEAEALRAEDRMLQQQRRLAELDAQHRASIIDLYRASGGGALLPGEHS